MRFLLHFHQPLIYILLVAGGITAFRADPWHEMPTATNAAILQAVVDLDSFWELSEDSVVNTVQVMTDLGLVSNGPDDTLGNFDLDRVDGVIAILDEQVSTMDVPEGLTAEDIVTNKYIEPSIGYADSVVRIGGANRWYEVTMGEGRNRIVRRLFESQGLQVSRLIRIAYGPVQLGRGIKAGSHREATAEEFEALLAAVGMQPQSVAPAKPRAVRGEAKARRSEPASSPARPAAGPRKPRR